MGQKPLHLHCVGHFNLGGATDSVAKRGKVVNNQSEMTPAMMMR